MAKLKNIAPKLDLAKYSVYIEDKTPTSTYFDLLLLPEVLTGGKNAFLINGTKFLKETTEVLVEIIDADGNPIFCKPIRNYLEGLARIVSVEVYEDTPPGIATMTILGELKYDESGNPVPEEWVGKYNIKHTSRFLVDPARVNTTRIRLYDMPQLEVEELLMPYREMGVSTTAVIESGSRIEAMVDMLIMRMPDPDKRIDIFVTSGSLEFTRDMIGGSFTASIHGSQFIFQGPPRPGYTGRNWVVSSSIVDVIHSTGMSIDATPVFRAFTENAYLLTRPYPLYGDLYSFWTDEFRIEYPSSSAYIKTEQNRSFAHMHLTNLTTFSGDIARAKFYVKNVDGLGTFEPVGEVILEQNELTLTQSFDTGEPNISVGNFLNQGFIDTYWIGDPITSSSYLTP